MKKSHVLNSIMIVIGLSPLGFLLIVWETIPETFVTRFELNRVIEEIQSRKELLIAVSVLSVLSVLLYLLMRNIRRLDPKVNDSTPKSPFHKLGIIVILFLAVFNYFLILSAKNEWTMDIRILLAVFGLLMALIGNYMNNIKPNYFAGIRLPWTLNDPENWHRTHLLAGKLWFAGGIVLIIGSFVFAKSILIPFAVTVLILLVVIPGIYSYKIYRNKLS
ncbi:MAG TPA: SdpI family protein [Flavitalea sp.]|nr:SdpI family protein [Flavitalea sp.]